jgi:site-specific recombinase XerD
MNDKQNYQDYWRNNINQHFSRLRRGKHTTRQAERRLLLSIANDVILLSLKVRKFHQLSRNDLKKLIACWKQRGNKNNTVYKKLSVIKKHYQVKRVDEVISYQKVKDEIKRKEEKPCPIIKLSDIEDDRLRFLFEGQVLFGLAFKEILALKPSLLCEEVIKVLRVHAFNGRERHVMIRTQQQQDWVSTYCKNFKTVWSTCSFVSLIRKQRQICTALRIPTNYFRYHYILWRYYDLLSQYHCIGDQERLFVFSKLRNELGYYYNATIKEKIQCLSKTYAMPLIAYTN